MTVAFYVGCGVVAFLGLLWFFDRLEQRHAALTRAELDGALWKSLAKSLGVENEQLLAENKVLRSQHAALQERLREVESPAEALARLGRGTSVVE